MEQLSNVKAIKEYFESGVNGRKVEMSELKELTAQERQEIADMCRAEL